MDILDSFNSMSLRFRACWDKYLGALILLHEPTKYDTYIGASSKKRTFVKLAKKWEGIMSRHIVRAITTVSRNGLIHWSSHAAFKFTNEQRTALEQCIEYFLHHNVDYPDPAIDLMSQHINSIDSIRTAEAHGTGLLRKWSLSSLSPATSRDFSLYNYSNDFSCYMRGLHDLLLERIGNNPG